jgi:hypothetical protein
MALRWNITTLEAETIYRGSRSLFVNSITTNFTGYWKV